MRISITKVLLLAFAFGLLCASWTFAAQERNNATISGSVQDASGAVVSGVEISLKSIECVCSKCAHDCDCCPDQHTTSDDSGRFSLSVGHGRYSVTLRKRGYREEKVDVDLTADDSKDVRVTMGGSGPVRH
jgi:hypothetical protein